ncbi:MAG: nucleotidyl transferase AbiEii/AbiGii toxin family protein [Bacteroidetes bacterium]|nr:nucleotidyl transferase AbiEii/AbiGii toxin family protein [Bacteroidota bacterium]MBS1641175.1 nucleotidyl transferase AbiEii/AbiGii toxin family protein [Bacteroidota bacterium]MBS1670845.1 nucleotidyl transferase AbiEii/AbiGii toxin family protein [Bacteroidota bacterium]
MHKEILNRQQLELLPFISSFKREYYLVGGTAIALYIGHRRSIDFDLFKLAAVNHTKNLSKITASGFPYTITRRVVEQMNVTINNVKLTFFQYPFEVKAENLFEQYIKVPSLLDLSAMKAYALGRRSKWKDYVDLYFIFNDYYSINDISKRAEELFGDMFSDKLFRAQLVYFNDINYEEAVDYIIPNPPTQETIKSKLIELATNIFNE